MNKILDGAKQALAFARGEGIAARITAHPGGPYIKGAGCGLIQQRKGDRYIVWNWDCGRWDEVREPVIIGEATPRVPV